MRFFRRIASLLGIALEEEEEEEDDDDGEGSEGSSASDAGAEDDEQIDADGPPGGPAVEAFGMQVPVVPERPGQAPIVVPCVPGAQGGVQGFKWYTTSLRIDDDGDVADEFLDEIVTTEVEVPTVVQTSMLTKLEVNYKTRPTGKAMRKHVFASNGNILHSFQYHERMMLA